jgi:FkbM family methyltransferase
MSVSDATLVSVIMPVFNGARFIERAFASLRAQTCLDWELLAVDDASADDSAARLDAFAASDPRVRVFRHPANRGQAAARNTALRAACGELIAYLDQDDEFYPDYLERAWELRARADVLLFRYDLVEERAGHPVLGGVTTYDPAHRLPHNAAETIAVPLGVVHRRDLLDRTGLFDESLGKYRDQDEDGELWRRFAQAGARFLPVPAKSGRYHVRADSFARVRPPAPTQKPASAPAPPGVVAIEVARGTDRHVLRMPAVDAWVVRQLFERGEYAGVRPEWLTAAPVVVDVGAHCGTFALYAELTIHPAAVHCFEPYPPHVELLRDNVASLAGVVVHPVGLGRADGTAEMLLDSGSGAGHSTVPSLVPKPAARVPVPIRGAAAAWDELGLGEVDVLKVDAEGVEAEILLALGPRLARTRVVLVEYHTPDERRRVDELLPGHLLFGAVIHSPRVGTLKYVRADLVPSPAFP